MTGDNPLASGPLQTRADAQRAVRDLYAPLGACTSEGGARVRLGSFGTVFEPRVAELEGFARPLYGIVPLVVGGGEFDGWERIVDGLRAGTDPRSPEYWGPIEGDVDQRMVEQAAIGLALAFCPDQVWEPLDPGERDALTDWLDGIFQFEPAGNNWQFFRVLVALGLERVGRPVPRGPLEASLDRIETFRRGPHWYVDGDLGNVDYYTPFALHTYGLMYVAAAKLGLGDQRRAEGYAERAAGFAEDFQHWFDPTGAAVPLGRSLTYRFAMASFWGAMAWADVSSTVSWGAMRGLSMRHLRWWQDKEIADRTGVLSVGFTYDNRVLSESYSSAGSPYWAMKAFAGLAAPADHPFWTSDEEPLAPLDSPLTFEDPQWVVARDDNHATVLPAHTAVPFEFPEKAAAKYRKFAYSSAFGFSGDVADIAGSVVTDSMMSLTDDEGNRRVRLGIEAAGVDGIHTWSVWKPFPDVRIDTVCWAIDGSTHGRVHRLTTGRRLTSAEAGFALGYQPDRHSLPADRRGDTDRAMLANEHGTTCIVGVATDGPNRQGLVHALAPNANLIAPNAAVPVLHVALEPGTYDLASIVFANPDPEREPPPHPAAVPAAAMAIIERTKDEASG